MNNQLKSTLPKILRQTVKQFLLGPLGKEELFILANRVYQQGLKDAPKAVEETLRAQIKEEIEKANDKLYKETYSLATTEERARRNAEFQVRREQELELGRLALARHANEITLARSLELVGADLIEKATKEVEAGKVFMVLRPPGLELRIFQDGNYLPNGYEQGYDVILVVTLALVSDNSFRLGAAGKGKTPSEAFETLVSNVRKMETLFKKP